LSQLFFNKWLRSQVQKPPRYREVLIYCTQRQSELESVLETIQKLEKLMSFGKVRIVVTPRPDLKGGVLEVSVVDSKEIS